VRTLDKQELEALSGCGTIKFKNRARIGFTVHEVNNTEGKFKILFDNGETVYCNTLEDVAHTICGGAKQAQRER
jgi:hypothetical protein